MSDEELEQIVRIVETTGKIQNVGADEDFYEAGFSSINALQLLMELESAFDVAIPDDDFVTARTCTALRAIVIRLVQKTP